MKARPQPRYLFVLAVLLTVSLLSVASRPRFFRTRTSFRQVAPPDTGDTTKNKKYRPRVRPNFKQADRAGDPFANTPSRSPLLFDVPPSTEQRVELDTLTGDYVIYEKLGGLDFRPVSTMTRAEYEIWKANKDQKDYMKSKSAGLDGETALASKNTIPRIYISPIFDRIFGGNYIDIRPNGSVLLDFGYRHQRVFNPALPIRQQQAGNFIFDQQIQLNAQGKIGEKLQVNINQDTKAAFDFDNTIKLDYTGFDHEILQKIEAGNVSLPISSSLITGAQNLFGLKTTMQFGKLKVVSVVSNQRGKTERLSIKNGAQTRDIALRINDYEDNRHYFVGHFFRNRYDAVNAQTPIVNSGTNTATPPTSGMDGTGATNPGTGTNPGSGTNGQIPSSSVNSGMQITRMELYVTNRANNTQTLRNIAVFQDLAEYDPLRPRWRNTPADVTSKPANNTTNRLYQTLINQRANVFDVNKTVNTLNNTLGMVRGEDYELVRGARKLEEGRDFKVQRQLGYLSLNTQLRDDEVLGVAFEYSFNGAVYKVGELQEDYSQRADSSVIVLKLLRPSQVRLDLPSWDLQMKNIYSLSGSQFSRENFSLRIIYRDDASGVDNPSLPDGKQLKDKPLVQVFNLDRLDPNNEIRPDGNFDYIEDVTVDSRNGRIIFPVTEPFGKFLESKFDQTDPNDVALASKYVFRELYRTTKADALQAANKAKFFLVGKAQTTSASEIQLGAFGISKGSVRLSAGSQQLTEGTDFEVDYDLGRVRIINPGILQSGREIEVTFEKADMFAFTQRSFFGSRFDYTVNKDFNVGATILYQNERPIIRRVTIGEEPSRNTLVGFDLNYKTDSRFLTKLVDALPLIQTKEISNITFSGEYAHLFPGANTFVDPSGKGISFLDDFEGARRPVHTLTQALRWRLASTPQGLEGGRNSPLTFNDRRALTSWYVIDQVFYNQGGVGKPKNISNEDLKNHYVRPVGPQEINKGRDLQQINLNEIIFDLAYRPTERGPYNFNPALTANGLLMGNPRENWGGIMTDFKTQTDFDYANVEYIEFWMMNPFLDGPNGKIEGDDNVNGRTGGRLVFDLGNISEDVMRDGRHLFENGLPITNDPAQYETTPVGRVPRRQILNRQFENDGGSRDRQDVGLDGLTNAEENSFTPYQEFVQAAQTAGVTGDALGQIQTDPANDDFRYFLGDDLDSRDVKILERYERFNGTQGNSPIPAEGQQFSQQGYNQPDNEDLNEDNTLNETESYYSYKVDFDPTKFKAGQNYIVNTVEGADGAKWHLFRVPIRELGHPNALKPTGSITDFKTIKFMRMYLTGFEAPVVCRFYGLQLLASEWRKYPKPLNQFGIGTDNEDDANFVVSTVNIEENGSVSDVGTQVPYTLAPGAQPRDRDITSGVNRRQNEQSLSLCITNLRDGDAKAVFKNSAFDMLNYKRLEMYVHAQTQDAGTQDKDLEIFVRLGTDFTENYYEVSVPLYMTKFLTGSSQYSNDQIWQARNFINADFAQLTGLKLLRNAARFPFTQPYTSALDTSEGASNQRYSVVGNPDLNAVVTVMLGVRNPYSSDGFPKSVCVWLNEFRVTDYIKNNGWATTGRFSAKLADLAVVNASGRYVTPGFGAIEQKISERTRATTAIYNVSANVTLDRFFPKKWGIRLPMYVAFERNTISPQYDPLNPDILVKQIEDTGRLSGYKRLIEDRTTRRSINFANIQKVKTGENARSYPWDVENLSFSFSYSDMLRTTVTIADFTQRQINYGAGYNYSSDAKPIEPFTKVKFLSSPWLKLIKDININLIPSNISFRGDINRFFTRQQLRSTDIYAPLNPALLTFEKSILFNRTYGVRWVPFKSLSIDYSANANAVVDEPIGDVRGDRIKQDTILKNVAKGGRLKLFNQNVRVGYKVPLDKLPVTDWISADLAYTASLNWAASPLALQDTLGNILQNTRDRAVNGRIDLLKLYNKIKFLNTVNNPTPPAPKAKPESKSIGKANTAKDAKATPVDPKAPKVPKGKDKDTVKKKPELRLLKQVLRTLMSVRNIAFQYQLTENTVLPGYRLTPQYAGFTSLNGAPGLPFVLGDQDPDIRFRAAEQGWLGNSRTQNQPFTQAITETFSANTTIEPVRDFRIRVDVRRTQSDNYREFFRMAEDMSGFGSFNPTRGGSYNITFISINTFRFDQSQGDDDKRRSREFLAFEENRLAVANRLNLLNKNSEINRPVGGDTSRYHRYNLNSQDVLIPAFVAAYTGKSAATGKLSAFPVIPLPNWRVDWAGLSRIPALAAIFPSINITHSYTSLYSVDSYLSSLRYGTDTLSLRRSTDILPAQGNTSGEFLPVYQIGQVVITEKFAPLIGINIRTKSKITIRADYNRDRSMALNLANAQVTELRSQDVTLGVGFAKSGIKLPIKNQGRPIILKNELTVRADLTIRDNLQIQRKIGELNEITNGGLDIQFKPTANYVVNQRLNLQFYFERTINRPRMASSYLRKVTAFGFQLRFALQ